MAQQLMTLSDLERLFYASCAISAVAGRLVFDIPSPVRAGGCRYHLLNQRSERRYLLLFISEILFASGFAIVM